MVGLDRQFVLRGWLTTRIEKFAFEYELKQSNRSDLKRENNQVLYVLFDSEEAMMMNERTKPTAING